MDVSRLLSFRFAQLFSTVGIKRMGEINENPFKDACLKKFLGNDWEGRSMELCSSWQAEVNDPNWQPFKKMHKNGKYQVCFLETLVLKALSFNVMILVMNTD